MERISKLVDELRQNIQSGLSPINAWKKLLAENGLTMQEVKEVKEEFERQQVQVIG